MALFDWLKAAAEFSKQTLKRFVEKWKELSALGRIARAPENFTAPEHLSGPQFPKEEEIERRWTTWHRLISSNVDETRYLASERLLEVVFLNNYYYQYYNVPPEVFQNFLTAKSPGKYVWNVLRADGYDYARIGVGAIPNIPHEIEYRKRFEIRRLLPEEIEANKQRIATLGPGQSAKMNKIPLKEADWRKWNRRATLEEHAAWSNRHRPPQYGP